MVTMEELLASLDKPLSLTRGMEVEGRIIERDDKEMVVDLGAKAEGIINIKDSPKLKEAKVGDKISVFVINAENENGQVVLSLQKGSTEKKRFPTRHSQLTGRVIEANKGGLIVEADGVTGFLPSSLTKQGVDGLTGMIGQQIQVQVAEVDQSQNILIFSQKVQVSEEQLQKYKSDDKVSGVVEAITPAGIVVTLEDEVTGFLPAAKLNPGSSYKAGQKLEVLIDSIDKGRKRINLMPILTSTKGLIYK